MLLSEVKSKIAFVIVTAYMSSVSVCSTLDDLRAPSKLIMEQITQLVFPKSLLQLVNSEMP